MEGNLAHLSQVCVQTAPHPPAGHSGCTSEPLPFLTPLPASCPDHSSSPLISPREGAFCQQVQSTLVFDR